MACSSRAAVAGGLFGRPGRAAGGAKAGEVVVKGVGDVNKRQHSQYDLLSRLESSLKPNGLVSKPGFIGRIPYLLVLRWAFFIGVLLRFFLFPYTGNPIAVYASAVVTGLLTLLSTYLTLRADVERPAWLRGMLIVCDLGLISLFYYWTGNPQSALLLFYFIPVFATTEHFGFRGMLAVSAVSIVAFSGVMLLLFLQDPAAPDAGEFFLRRLLPRVVFFANVFILSSWLRQLERNQKTRLSEHEEEIQTLLDFRVDVSRVFNVKRVLELTIERAVGAVGAVGGHAMLLDHETDRQDLVSYTPRGYFREECALTGIENLSRRAVQQRRPDHVARVQSNSDLSNLFCSQVGYLLCVPITTHDTILGTITVGGKETARFDADTERFLQALAGQAASAIERSRLLTSLAEIGKATVASLELDARLDAILCELTESLRFEFATISLVDEYRGVVETIRGSNVPQGWIGRARHSLSNSDIQADIVRTKKTEVLEGWDERFDKEIYHRFGHENLVRVFAPLRADNSVVGVIEAGCQKERREEILTSETCATVQRLGHKWGKTVARTRPYVLLKLIADHATGIIGADSASLHVYQAKQTLLIAGAGKADKEFLAEFPPRLPSRENPEGGIGCRAMKTGSPILIDEPQELALINPKLYARGVRAIVAFPLFLGTDVQGVLYVHFWREHRFSEAELELERVFARQMEVAIQNSLLLKSMSAIAQRAWALPSFQNLLQSLASGLSLSAVLGEVAQNTLYVTDADNVTLYQYFENTDKFIFPPVMRGTFENKDAMLAPRDRSAFLLRIIRDGTTQFVEDVSQYEELYGTRPKAVDGHSRFAERERIKSSAAVVLRAGGTSEIVGLMFVNHRDSHRFSDEEKRTINALASSAAVAIQTARLYERVSQDLERQVSYLRALSTIATRIQNPRYSLDTVLRLFLTGVTIGEGLGFSRAHLFLTNDDEATLCGEVAIGALAEEEARTIWRELGEEADAARKKGKDILTALLDKAEALSIAIAEGRELDLPLSTVIQQHSMPIKAEAGALAVCVLEGKTIIVKDSQPDPFREIIQQVTRSGNTGYAFACVPLVEKKGVIGVLVVDNRFLEREREIEKDAIDYLEAFAGLMAMSVENNRLRDRLADEQRMETWKEFTARITHTIGTRVGVIEGWLTMLRSHLLEEGVTKEREPRETQALLENLSAGISKTEVVLNDLRTFTLPLELRVDELDLVQLLQGAIREVEHKLSFSIDLLVPDKSPFIVGDPARLSDAFIELINNAQEAVQQDTDEETLMTISVALESEGAESDPIARIDFVNTGQGIPAEYKEHIFEPYFTTKGRGSGLGLAIVRKIIQEHQGTIVEVGEPGVDARFVVRLSCLESDPGRKQKGEENDQNSHCG